MLDLNMGGCQAALSLPYDEDQHDGWEDEGGEEDSEGDGGREVGSVGIAGHGGQERAILNGKIQICATFYDFEILPNFLGKKQKINKK